MPGPDEYAASIDTEQFGVIMKQCPLNENLECEECRMNFGPGKCGIFSLAADLSYQTEMLKKILKLLEKILIEK